jgi:predicted anti-sigma-YlaC factor YlaD
MSCQLVRTYLSAFMDAALPGSKMAHIWKHINSCSSCYEVYDALFVADQFFSGVMTENVPAVYRHSLRARMDECVRNTKADSTESERSVRSREGF